MEPECPRGGSRSRATSQAAPAGPRCKHTHLTVQPPLTPREENCACVQGLGFSTGLATTEGAGRALAAVVVGVLQPNARGAVRRRDGLQPQPDVTFSGADACTSGPLFSQTGARFPSAGFLRDSHRQPSLLSLELHFTTQCTPLDVCEPVQTSGLAIDDGLQQASHKWFMLRSCSKRIARGKRECIIGDR